MSNAGYMVALRMWVEKTLREEKSPPAASRLTPTPTAAPRPRQGAMNHATEMFPAVAERNGLIDEIRAALAAIQSSVRRSLEDARRAGELLIQAKEFVPHGEWEKWLSKHFSLSGRTAAGYMRLARRWDELREKVATVATLGLREALVELTDRERAPARLAGTLDLNLPRPRQPSGRPFQWSWKNADYQCPRCGCLWSGDPMPARAVPWPKKNDPRRRELP